MSSKRWWGLCPKDIRDIHEFLNPPFTEVLALPIVMNADAQQNYPSPMGPMDADREAIAAKNLTRIGEEQKYRRANSDPAVARWREIRRRGIVEYQRARERELAGSDVL